MASYADFEHRYHIVLVDDNGIELNINNLSFEEVNEWEESHIETSLDYYIEKGPIKNRRAYVR
jgi:hypothetical protein